MNELQKLNYKDQLTQAIDLLTRAKEGLEPLLNMDKAIKKIANAHHMVVQFKQ